MSIHTPLGEDALLLQGFTGHEGISQLFTFDLHILREGIPIFHEDLVGANVTVQLILRGDETRYVNGYISRLSTSAGAPGIFHYQAELVPWLWFLTQTADCRIFQEKTVPDIIEQIFKEYGFTDYKLQLGSYEPREYCVQYRETDFQFVSRLMEQYGIFYFWEHEEEKHTLVIADASSSHQPVPFQSTASWEPAGSASYEEDVITSLDFAKDFRPGKVTHRGFNFKQSPSGRHSAHTEPSIIEIAGNSAFEIYDYEGKYDTKKAVTSIAKVRMQEEEAQQFVITGASMCKAFTAGYKYTLEGNPLPPQWNQEYVLTSVHHQASMGNTYNPGGPIGGEDGDPSYTNTFTCIPFTVPFRPPQLTPKPVVQGPQTAIVVGKKGEEIWVDKYGRVKVLFHWDREGKGDEQSSCWVRVSQLWAGKQWGAMFLPRIGQEVIVEFLEGDPDRPIITGRVYNAENIPPYELPAEQTKSTIKSNSSKGGKGFNELRFEDKKGDEQIFIHGEKDEDIRIKNDAREWIGNERHLIVKKDQLESVEGDQHSSVKGDRLEKTEGDHGASVKGDHLLTIDGSDHLAVKGDLKTKVDGDVNLKSDSNLNQEAGMKISIKSGQDFHGKAGMNFAMDAGMAVHIKGGMTVVIEGGTQISLKAGGSFVDIGQAGVSISGPMVMINSGGAAGSGSGSSPTAPAATEIPDPPKLPKEADKAKPGKTAEAPKPTPPPKPTTYSASALVMKQAAKDGTPFCEECEKAKQEAAAGAQA